MDSGTPEDGELQLTWVDLTTNPAEDVGAETQARFRYQAEVIARDAIGLLLGGVVAVICEWEEDAIVFYADSTAELVSVKHREPSQGPWTRAGLISDGGVRHLLGRWQDIGRRARCRLSTNAGLNSQAEELRATCASGDSASVAALSLTIAAALGVDAPTAASFLTVLRIETGLPHRDHMAAVSIQELVRPALTRMKLRRYPAEGVYEAIVRSVEVASRDRAGGSHEFVDVIADPRRLDRKRLAERRLTSRTLLPEDLRIAIATVAAEAPPRLVVGSLPEFGSALEQKLREGGLGPTAINDAKRLRAVWTYFEAEFDDPFSDFRDDVQDLITRVQTAAGVAETEARIATGGGAYGLEMHRRLPSLLEPAVLGMSGSIPVEASHIEGLAYELTDRCRIWWSPEFEIVVR